MCSSQSCMRLEFPGWVGLDHLHNCHIVAMAPDSVPWLLGSPYCCHNNDGEQFLSRFETSGGHTMPHSFTSLRRQMQILKWCLVGARMRLSSMLWWIRTPCEVCLVLGIQPNKVLWFTGCLCPEKVNHAMEKRTAYPDDLAGVIQRQMSDSSCLHVQKHCFVYLHSVCVRCCSLSSGSDMRPATVSIHMPRNSRSVVWPTILCESETPAIHQDAGRLTRIVVGQ